MVWIICWFVILDWALNPGARDCTKNEWKKGVPSGTLRLSLVEWWSVHSTMVLRACSWSDYRCTPWWSLVHARTFGDRQWVSLTHLLKPWRWRWCLSGHRHSPFLNLDYLWPRMTNDLPLRMTYRSILSRRAIKVSDTCMHQRLFVGSVLASFDTYRLAWPSCPLAIDNLTLS